MDDFDDFDENLLQAVDQYESSYYKATTQQPASAQQPAHQAPAQHLQAHPPSQPLEQHVQQQAPNPAGVHSLWQMFCNQPPTSGSNTSSCTGWAGRRLQPRLRHYQHSQQQPRQLDRGYWPQQQQQQQGYQQIVQQSSYQQQQQQQQQQQSSSGWQRPGQHMQQQQPPQWQHQQQPQQHPWASKQQVQPGPWGQQRQQQQHCQAPPLQPQALHQLQQQQQGNQWQASQWQQQQQPPGMLQCPAGPGTATWQGQGACNGRPGTQQGGSVPVDAASRATATGGPTGAGTACSGGQCSSAAGCGPSSAAATGVEVRLPPPPPPSASAGAAVDAAAGSGGQAAASGAAAGAGAMSGAVGAAGAGGGASGGPRQQGPIATYNAKLALGGKGLVEVCFSGYHDEIARVCSAIPGVRRPKEATSWTKSWLVPSDKLNQLMTALKNMQSVNLAKVDPLPDIVVKIMAAARKQPDDSALYDCLKQLQLAPGESLEQRMMPFQREGVQFGLRAGGRVLIGDEMGLGKTVQACALAKCYQAEWPVLVICPASLRLSWGASLYDWLRVTDDRVLVVLKKTDMEVLARASSDEAAQKMFDFVVVSCDMLKDLSLVLEAIQFKVVILDESHCIKNGTTIRAKHAKTLLTKAKRTILLSGTPALSRPTELLTQLQALLPAAHITKAAFEDRYADVQQFARFKKANGSKNEDELNKLLTSTVMIRRRKGEVLKDLPAKLRKQVVLELPTKERKELSSLKERLQEVRSLTTDMYGVGQEVGGGVLAGMEMQQRSMIMGLWHDTARIKAKAVTSYVADLLENMSDPDDKFLVFAYHRELMDAIEAGVNSVKHSNKEFRDLKYMRIDGSTNPKQREKNVNMFQEEANCRVAILNIKAAGVGLTLTRASTVVFAELDWTPSMVLQAEDRAHRIGQTQCVSVQLLLVKDSIDEVMWEMLQSKLATTGQVLDGQADRMEVEKSGGVHRPRGNGRQDFWQHTQDSTQPVDHQQKSITSFFTSNGDAFKKQRLT